MKKKAKRKDAVVDTQTLYVRKVRTDVYDWIKKQADQRGYCPSTLLNRLVDYARKETKLEML